jgi:hypothetical protein
MSAAELTDEKIQALRTFPKKVTSGSRKPKIKAGHFEMDFEAASEDGSRFRVFARQNRRLADDFSCGIRWEAPSGEAVTLARYNGPSHPHPNPLEGTRLVGVCHIHTATERYIRLGRQPETFAVATDRYHDLDGAMAALAEDFAITGLVDNSPQMKLSWN